MSPVSLLSSLFSLFLCGGSFFLLSFSLSSFSLPECPAERQAASLAELQPQCSAEHPAAHLAELQAPLVLTGTGERRLAKPASPPLLPLLMCPRLMAMCIQLSIKASEPELQAAELQAWCSAERQAEMFSRASSHLWPSSRLLTRSHRKCRPRDPGTPPILAYLYEALQKHKITFF